MREHYSRYVTVSKQTAHAFFKTSYRKKKEKKFLAIFTCFSLQIKMRILLSIAGLASAVATLVPVVPSPVYGNIIRVYVGNPEQELYFSAAFELAYTRIFHPSISCPFSASYDESASSSLFDDEIGKATSGGILDGKSFQRSETIRVGDVVLEHEPFHYVTESSYADALVVSVSGRLGLAPGSRLATENIFQLHPSEPVPAVDGSTAQGFGLSLTSEIPAAPANVRGVTTRLGTHPRSWSVVGSMSLNDDMVGRTSNIVIDPTVNGIEFPASSTGAIMETLELQSEHVILDPYGRFMLPCAASGVIGAPLNLRINLADGQRVMFRGRSNLGNRTYFREIGTFMCSTDFKQSNTGEWVIGSPILASLDSLILSGPTGQMIFRMSTLPVLLVPLDISGYPVLPTFESFSLSEGDDGRTISLSFYPSAQAVVGPHYVLVNSGLKSFRNGYALTFMSANPRNVQPNSNYAPQDMFTLLSEKLLIEETAEGEIMVSLLLERTTDPTGALQLHVSATKASISVILTPVAAASMNV